MPGPSGKAGSGDVPQPVVAPPFLPTFLQGVTGAGTPLNSDYYATKETADTLCKRLQCSFVSERPCPELQEPFFCSALQWWMTFPDCFTVNAGKLAAYFDRNHEDLYPHVAENAIADVMARDRAAQKPTCVAALSVSQSASWPGR